MCDCHVEIKRYLLINTVYNITLNKVRRTGYKTETALGLYIDVRFLSSFQFYVYLCIFIARQHTAADARY